MTRQEAELKVARILKEYEESASRVVRSIELENIKITTIGAGQSENYVRVVIEAERLPGHYWAR